MPDVKVPPLWPTPPVSDVRSELVKAEICNPTAPVTFVRLELCDPPKAEATKKAGDG